MSNIASNKLGNNGGRAYSFLNRPVTIDCNFIVDSQNGNGLGIRSLKGSGVQQVFMNTAAPLAGSGNPNPAAGYALIQLSNNYNRYCGGYAGFVAPVTGSSLAINGTALTPGNPYIITSVGAGSDGTVTIAPVADSSGSLASTYFTIPDAFGNLWAPYMIVNGVGIAPQLSGVTPVPIVLATNASADTITTAISVALLGLRANLGAAQSAPAIAPFTTSGAGGATLTVVSVMAKPLPGPCQDGTIATGFTFAVTKDQTNGDNWRAVGLPQGVEPNVGAAFIATTSGYSTRGGSTGTVEAVGVANIQSVQVVGDPNQSIGPIPRGGSPNVGAWIMVQFLAPTGSSTTTPVATAPTDGDVVGMTFVVEAASITILGE